MCCTWSPPASCSSGGAACERQLRWGSTGQWAGWLLPSATTAAEHTRQLASCTVHVPWLWVSAQGRALPVPQLLCSPDVTLRITFADAASVPRLVRLEHAPSPTAAFGRLGDIMLQPKSLKQLRHLFRCGQWLAAQAGCIAEYMCSRAGCLFYVACWCFVFTICLTATELAIQTACKFR